jgi:hypothetical protein
MPRQSACGSRPTWVILKNARDDPGRPVPIADVMREMWPVKREQL